MARARTTSDAFNAVAEPRRRQILALLVVQELPVGELVTALDLDQPSVSKHLRVLRDVGLVRVRRQGRHKFYRTNAAGIRPLYEWTQTFERYWSHQLSRVQERAEEKARANRQAEPKAKQDSPSIHNFPGLRIETRSTQINRTTRRSNDDDDRVGN